MKALLLSIVILSFLKAHSQDTTYFDKTWKKTSKSNATHYRLQSKEGSRIKILQYYSNDTLQMTGYAESIDPGKTDAFFIKNGFFKYYDEKGIISRQGNYINNVQIDEWQTFYPDGKLYYTENYDSKGKETGKLTVYYPDGKIKRTDNYSKGDFKNGKCFTRSGNDTTWYPFLTMPEFPGGDKVRNNFLAQNLNYPIYLAEKGIQGIVLVSFIIGSEGKIENIELVNKVYQQLDDEALRVVKMMPRWKPGTQDGKPYRVTMYMPITFKIQR